MPDALGEATAPEARAECSLRVWAALGFVGRDMPPPTDPIQPHAQAFHAFPLFLFDECPDLSLRSSWT